MALTFNQAPAKYPIRFVAGDDVPIPFQILQQVTANNITTNVPVNITGYTFGTGITINGIAFNGNINVISASNGTITANYNDTLTSGMSPGCWPWYLTMTDTSNYTRTIILDCAEILSRA